MLTTLELREEAYDSPAAALLVAALQVDLVARYGGGDDTPVDPREFDPPDGAFLVGYLDGAPIACGALRPSESASAEIKRMYVVPEHRRRGHSRTVLRALEEHARRCGYERIRLETGLQQPEAIRLYETSGYERIESYGYYRCEPDSVCYGKLLRPSG